MTGLVRVLWRVMLVALLVGFAATGLAVEETPNDVNGENKPVAEDKTPDKPLVRCIIVLPPNGKPHKDLQKRMTLVMKDLQWWYACQMEAYGYGLKTFSLETDKKGNVIVHQTRLDEEPGTDPNPLMKRCIQKAEKVFGTFGERKDTVMLVLYGDYIWANKKQYKSVAYGRGCDRRWAFLTSWHYFNANPRGWPIKTKAKNFKDRKRHLGPVHAKVLATSYPNRSIGNILSSGHGGIAHELGHAFGLHHAPEDGNHIKGDLMTADLWYMRGGFSRKFPREYCVLSPKDAAVLDKNPVFTICKKVKPVTRASKKWTVRGIKKRRKRK